jgi:hypothetical protein
MFDIYDFFALIIISSQGLRPIDLTHEKAMIDTYLTVVKFQNGLTFYFFLIIIPVYEPFDAQTSGLL